MSAKIHDDAIFDEPTVQVHSDDEDLFNEETRQVLDTTMGDGGEDEGAKIFTIKMMVTPEILEDCKGHKRSKADTTMPAVSVPGTSGQATRNKAEDGAGEDKGAKITTIKMMVTPEIVEDPVKQATSLSNYAHLCESDVKAINETRKMGKKDQFYL